MPTLFRTRIAADTGAKRPIIDLQDVKLPEVKLPDVKMSDVKLPDVKLPEVNVPEMPKVDVGKAVLGVATAAGLVKRRRSRWPFLVGAAAAAVAVTAWALTNAAVRERVSRAVAAVGDRVRAMQGGQDQAAIAFPAAATAPITEPANLSVPPSSNPDYPEGFGAENQTRSTTDSPANNGHERATVSR